MIAHAAAMRCPDMKVAEFNAFIVIDNDVMTCF